MSETLQAVEELNEEIQSKTNFEIEFVYQSNGDREQIAFEGTALYDTEDNGFEGVGNTESLKDYVRRMFNNHVDLLNSVKFDL